MPLYEYQCEACRHRFEHIQKFSDPLLDTCPVCGGILRKLMSSPAIQFKGSGFYITDYPKESAKTDGGSGDSPEGRDKSEKPGSLEKSERTEKSDKSDKEKSDKSEKTEKTDKSEKKSEQKSEKPSSSSDSTSTTAGPAKADASSSKKL